MERIAILGGGLMGHGIAQVFAVAGHSVAITDEAPAALETVHARVRANLERAGGDPAAAGRIELADGLEEAVRDADLVVEAAPEDLELKRALFELVPPEEAVPAAADETELVDYLVYRPQPARRPYRVFRTDRGFRVTGRAPESAELEAILKAAGAREGDEVEVGEETLEWQ